MSSRRDLIRERAAAAWRPTFRWDEQQRRWVDAEQADEVARRADLFRRLRERDEVRERERALGLDGGVAAHLAHRRDEPDCERCRAADELAAAITAAAAG